MSQQKKFNSSQNTSKQSPAKQSKRYPTQGSNSSVETKSSQSSQSSEIEKIISIKERYNIQIPNTYSKKKETPPVTEVEEIADDEDNDISLINGNLLNI